MSTAKKVTKPAAMRRPCGSTILMGAQAFAVSS
jgi:hypothetical protein